MTNNSVWYRKTSKDLQQDVVSAYSKFGGCENSPILYAVEDSLNAMHPVVRFSLSTVYASQKTTLAQPRRDKRFLLIFQGR